MDRDRSGRASSWTSTRSSAGAGSARRSTRTRSSGSSGSTWHEREGPITRAGFSVVEYERWLGDHDPQHLRDLADYNRDDCVSTRGLRDWLEARRSEAELRFHTTFERPTIGTGLPSEAQVAISEETLRRVRTDLRRDARSGRPQRTRRPPDGCWPRSSTGTAATRAKPGGITSGCASCPWTISSASRSRSLGSGPTTESWARSVESLHPPADLPATGPQGHPRRGQLGGRGRSGGHDPRRRRRARRASDLAREEERRVPPPRGAAARQGRWTARRCAKRSDGSPTR